MTEDQIIYAIGFTVWYLVVAYVVLSIKPKTDGAATHDSDCGDL